MRTALVRQIGPPLLLLPLLAASFDATWLIAWLIGGLAALASLVTLGGLSRKKPGMPRFNRETMIRPLLTIAIVATAYGSARFAEADAERYGQQLMTALSRACKEQGRCPAAPDGWRQHGREARTTRGPWSFTYATDPTRVEFGLVIHQNWETERCIHGGSAIEPRELVSVDCRHDPQVPEKLQALLRP